MIDVLPLPGFIETRLDIDADVNFLINDSDIAQMRDGAGADVVVLLTNGNYSGSIKGVAAFETLPDGSVNSNLGNPQAHLGFAIIEAESALANFTFTHELGHVMDTPEVRWFRKGNILIKFRLRIFRMEYFSSI